MWRPAMDAFRIASLVVVLGNQLFSATCCHMFCPPISEYRVKGLEYEDGDWLFPWHYIESGFVDLRFLGMVGSRGTGRAAGAGFGSLGRGCFLLMRCFSRHSPDGGSGW